MAAAIDGLAVGNIVVDHGCDGLCDAQGDVYVHLSEVQVQHNVDDLALNIQRAVTLTYWTTEIVKIKSLTIIFQLNLLGCSCSCLKLLWELQVVWECPVVMAGLEQHQY